MFLKMQDLTLFLTKLDPSAELKAYVDGACSGNPGPGGWGVYLQQGSQDFEFSGGSPHTTNNQMELMAAIEALTRIPPKSFSIRIYTDSTYVKNGITLWIHNWKLKGWKTAGNAPVKNQDLWQKLEAVSSQHTVQWEWLKGHSGIPGNERADALAQQAIIAQRMAL